MIAVVGCTRSLRYFGYVEIMESGNQVTSYLIVLVRFYKIIMCHNLLIVDIDDIKASLCKFCILYFFIFLYFIFILFFCKFVSSY